MHRLRRELSATPKIFGVEPSSDLYEAKSLFSSDIACVGEENVTINRTALNGRHFVDFLNRSRAVNEFLYLVRMCL